MQMESTEVTIKKPWLYIYPDNKQISPLAEPSNFARNS